MAAVDAGPPHRRARRPPDSLSPPPLTRVAVIANPAAGAGRGRRAAPGVEASLRAAGLWVCAMRSASLPDAERLARGVASGVDAVVAVGGDGTLQAIVNGLLAVPAPPALAVVPAGRGNDFARALSVPSDVGAAARLILAGAVRAIDVGRSGGRHWLTAGGVGLDAEVAAGARDAPRWQHGALPYVLSTLRALRRHTGRELVLRLDGRVVVRRCAFVAVANTPCYGGGMHICPGADPTDGLLDVCVVGDIGRAELLRMLPGVFAGRHVGHPAVEFHRARAVVIEGPPGTLAHVDGESAGVTPAEFAVVPAALRVLAPAWTGGGAP